MIRLVIVLSGIAVAAVVVLALTDGGPRADPARGAGPVVRACDRTSSVRPLKPSRGDLRAGRVTISAFRSNFERARAGDVYTRDGAKVLKAPVVFTGGRDLTLESGSGAMRLGVVRGRAPARAVAFEACPGRRGATGSAGEIRWRGPWPACAPLKVDGRRVLLPLGKRC